MYLFLVLGLLWLAYINVLASVVSREDNRRAAAGIARISPTELFVIAAAGGWFALKLTGCRPARVAPQLPSGPLLNLMPAAWLCAVVLLAPLLWPQGDGSGDLALADPEAPATTLSR
ncbi:hypothetical protein R5H30_03880 [Sulfitobacter sp. D35]|uniref:hypothetical protein n=1 Tax=Sulfitobacter sp. D35 TaxID=3083252 RepID=UPI00296E8E1B|nr:hypothetical protein [Sulfitobacter sp. D35]MDW4497110.1 hypothetical protein [Sulfitobacter sp. D35]